MMMSDNSPEEINKINKTTKSKEIDKEVGKTSQRCFDALRSVSGIDQNSFLTLDIDKDEVIAKIKECEKNKDIFEKGSEGVIYKIIITTKKGNKVQLIAAKKRFDGMVSHELKMQQKAYNITKTNEKTDWKGYVRVPKIYGKIDISGDSYILMEYIEGKTLFQLYAEGIAKRYSKGTVNFATNQDAANYLNMINNAGIGHGTNDVDEKYKNLKKDGNYEKPFPYEKGQKYIEAMKSFIKYMHDRGLYHRDVHEKNIIYKNGKFYLIDFGHAIDDDEFSGDPYEENNGKRLKDAGAIALISGLVKTRDEQEMEKETANNKKQIDKIKGSVCVYELFDTWPTGFEMRNNERKNFKMSLEKETVDKALFYVHIVNADFRKKGAVNNKGEYYKCLFSQGIENVRKLINDINIRLDFIKKNIDKENTPSKKKKMEIEKERLKYLEKDLKRLRGLIRAQIN